MEHEERCPDPYYVQPDASSPASCEEASALVQEAHDARPSLVTTTATVPGIVASHWGTEGTELSVEVEVCSVLHAHGPGVYTVILWEHIDREVCVQSRGNSIFHDIPRPAGND